MYLIVKLNLLNARPAKASITLMRDFYFDLFHDSGIDI